MLTRAAVQYANSTEYITLQYKSPLSMSIHRALACDRLTTCTRALFYVTLLHLYLYLFLLRVTDV